MEEKRSNPRLSFEETPGRWWRNIVVPSLPVLACFLGGATEKWSEGIIVVLLGVILLIDPPRFSAGPALNVILLIIVACAAMAFLPGNWFAVPTWRQILTGNFGITLPGTISPQPFVSLECFVSLIAGMSWLYFVSTLEGELRDGRQQIRIFSTGIILLAALSLALYSAQGALPFWHNQRGFGPFPNRNQTGNLFGLTAVLIVAVGQDDIRHGRKRWFAWLVGLGLVIAAIVTNFSRAGVVILIAGIALWVGGFVLRKRSAMGMALGLSVLLLLLATILIFGGPTFERFHLRSGDVGLAPDLRWAIFKDTLQLIRSSPWCGIGLGNFDEVFAMFRNASLNGTRTIHPESDWLWLWAEAGWLAIPLAIAGLMMLVRRVFPLHEGTNQRFRLAALIAAILFVLHGLVDVSGHRVGTAYSAIFFLGLALRRPLCLQGRLWVPWLFRGIGILIFVAGIIWVVASRSAMPLPGGLGVEIELRKATMANRGADYKEAILRTSRALDWAPLQWQLYFARAIGEVGAARQSTEALADFRRARFLEPNAFEVPYQEGVVWLAREPALALSAWEEALRRVGVQRLEIYGHMLAQAAERSPIVREGLEKIGAASHDLALVYLRGASGSDFISALHDILENDPGLRTFSSDEKTKLFSLWEERGDPEGLMQGVEAQPDWMKEAWRAVARHQGNEKHFRTAFELVERFGTAPATPQVAEDSSIDQLQQMFHANPDDFGIGYRLYREQMKSGRTDDALMTVRHFSERPNCPLYFHYLEAKAWATKENWERAWSAWKEYEGDEQKQAR